MQRRHDIDALRALAFGLLILYHLCMFYVADWGWHVKSVHLAGWLQFPMLFVNRWRMELVFMVSGMAAAFLLKPDRVWRFVRQRNWRLMLPLLFGMAFIIPIQPYAQGVSNGKVAPGFWTFLLAYWSHSHWPKDAFDGWQYGFTWNHLWYLFYLWMYTLALALLAKPLASPMGQRVTAWFTGLRGWKLMVLPALPILLYVVTLQDRFPDTHDFFRDWYANPLYFTMFLYGFLIARAEGFWTEVVRLRRTTLGLALAIFVPYILLGRLLPDDAPHWQGVCIWALRVAYIWTMLLAILGWAHALLNRPFRWLPWATESVYPWYVLHQSLIVGLGFWLTPYHLGPVSEPLVILVGTVTGCFLLSEGIKRVSWLRPCFGLKALPKRNAMRAIAAAASLHDDCA
ncbi:MAG TPA: acyltransferase [Xanthomonadaceae bacterium]|jgi:peptidoglycan/LPS O-acetylase OafA/YrhL